MSYQVSYQLKIEDEPVRYFDSENNLEAYIKYRKQVEQLVEGFSNKWGHLTPKDITFKDIAQYLLLNDAMTKVCELCPQEESEVMGYWYDHED